MPSPYWLCECCLHCIKTTSFGKIHSHVSRVLMASKQGKFIYSWVRGKLSRPWWIRRHTILSSILLSRHDRFRKLRLCQYLAVLILGINRMCSTKWRRDVYVFAFVSSFGQGTAAWCFPSSLVKDEWWCSASTCSLSIFQVTRHIIMHTWNVNTIPGMTMLRWEFSLRVSIIHTVSSKRRGCVDFEAPS
jgi:hypothetical protein